MTASDPQALIEEAAELRSRGRYAEAVRQGVQAQSVVIPDYGSPHGGKWGQFPDKVLSTYADFLGIKVPNADSLYTNELIDAVNDFDPAAVVQKAKDFK